jgi:hypothetical protein
MKHFKKGLKEFSSLPNEKKLTIFFLLFFLFVFSFFVSILYWQKQSSPLPLKAERAVPVIDKTQSDLASLSLAPQNQMVKEGETFLVTVNINTGDYNVDTVDVVLTFDPQILSVEEISQGLFFANYPIKKWEEGKVIITATIEPEQSQIGGIKGEGPFATITFKALTDGVAQVNFDNNSLVAAQGENVLGKTEETKYEIY